jgi:hypothetical protein
MIPDSAIEPIDQRERGASLESVDYVQTVQAVQAPFLILPRVAGEERQPAPDSIRGVGWNDWNDWNKRSSDCRGGSAVIAKQRPTLDKLVPK